MNQVEEKLLVIARDMLYFRYSNTGESWKVPIINEAVCRAVQTLLTVTGKGVTESNILHVKHALYKCI